MVVQFRRLVEDCRVIKPFERTLELTRRCLEVFIRFKNPVGIITKNHLVTRDLDYLEELARNNLVMVTISITSLDDDLIRKMEPRTSITAKRFEAVRMLAQRGIPVGVNVAPIIPGLTDEEIPSILERSAASGARFASYTIVRLTGAVEPLFLDWLKRELPERAGKIENRIRDTRGGKLTDPRFGKRMKGEGEIAKTIKRLFQIHCEKYGFYE